MEADELEANDKTPFESLGFTHPLLALMPYAPSVPSHLRALQDKVIEAMNPNLPYLDRLSAALGGRRTIDNLGLGAKEAAKLAIDLFRGINKLLLSAAVLEQYTWACLDHDRIGLDSGKFTSLPERPLPILVDFEPEPNRPTSISRLIKHAGALDVWTNVSQELSARSPENLAMCAADLRASLRMLILFLMYADPDRSRPTSPARLNRFEGMGLSLWDSLLTRLREAPGYKLDDEQSFGPAIQTAMWHFLRSNDLAQQNRAVAGESLMEPVAPAPAASMHVVVRGEIPPGTSEEDRQALTRLECLRLPLPVALLPEVSDIDAIHSRLASEFPWAEVAVAEVTDDLRSRRLFGGVEVGMAATLLVGLPGCGKSRLARRIAEELRVPFLPMSLAGMSDTRAILGTTRGWASGEASPLVRLLANKMSASAIVMVDEIDKASSGTRGDAGPTSALLNLLEVENAKSWYDTFLQTNCDLSKMMFIATANRLSVIPKPLLSRLRIIHVPEPRAADFRTIAKGALCDIASEWGLPPGTFKELEDAVPVGPARNAREVRAYARSYLTDWAKRSLGPGRTH